MSGVTLDAALADIRAGRLAPVYLVRGDDEIGKSQIVDAIVASVEADLRAFNVERLYGDQPDTTIARLIDAARTLPMLAGRRIIVVVRADQLLAPKRENERTVEAGEALARYVAAPEPHAVLVLVATKPDGRKAVVRKVEKGAVVVVCGDLEPGRGAESWVKARLAERGLQAEAAAVHLLVDRAGADAPRLRAEIDRLAQYTGGRRRVTVPDVEAIAGAAVSKQWAVANAIQAGRAAEALRELGMMLDEGEAPLRVLGQLRWVVSAKLPPARAAAGVEAVFRTDLDLKSSAGDPRILLERLVVELCGAAPAGAMRGTSRRA